MKKAAKTLSVAVVSVGALAAVIVTAWIVHAQAQQPIPEGQQTAAGLDLAAMSTEAVLQEGKRLKGAEQYAEALPLLQEALRREPANDPAAIMAGVCLEKQGQYQEALQYYQMATGEKSGFRSTALYCSAVCYRELGDTAKALEMLDLQQKCDPIGKWRMKGVALKAEIEGRPQAEIDQLVGREQEAARLYRQARDLMRETKAKSPEPLDLFDQVLAEYPETGASFSALSQKAELLWHLDEYEEMCECYGKLREILKQQPYSENVRLMLRTMDSRIAQHRTEQLLTQIKQELDAGRKVDGQYWDRLNVLWDRWRHNTDDPNAIFAAAGSLFKQQVFRQKAHEPLDPSAFQQVWDDCQTVIDSNPADVPGAEITLLQGELLYWQEQFPQSVGIFDRVVQDFEGKIPQQQGKDIVLLKNIVMMAHQFAGYAHLKSGDLDEAIQHFTIVVDVCKDDPNAVHGKNAIAAGACLGLWQVYSLKGAQDGMLSMESLMRDRWPDGLPARYLKFEKAKLASGQ